MLISLIKKVNIDLLVHLHKQIVSIKFHRQIGSTEGPKFSRLDGVRALNFQILVRIISVWKKNNLDLANLKSKILV